MNRAAARTFRLGDLLRLSAFPGYSWARHLLLLAPLLAVLLVVACAKGVRGEEVRLGFAQMREALPGVTLLLAAVSDHAFHLLIAVYVYLLARGLGARDTVAGRERVLFALRFAVGALLFGLLLTQLLKNGFGLPRPGFPLPREPFSFRHEYASFPSGHTVNIFMSALPLALWSGRCRDGLALSLLIAAVGFSRLWLGAHHPVDILGGLLVGSLAARWIAVKRTAN